MPDPQRTFLVSNRYQVTSELAFYVPGRPPAYNFNLGRRLNQYDFWEGPDSRLGWDAVYVEEGAYELDRRVAPRSTRVDPPVVLEITRGERVIRVFSLHRAYGFRGAPTPPAGPGTEGERQRQAMRSRGAVRGIARAAAWSSPPTTSGRTSSPATGSWSRCWKAMASPSRSCSWTTAPRTAPAARSRGWRPRIPGSASSDFRRNAGQTAALHAGFQNARGTVVVTMDADLQNDPHDIPKLLGALPGQDAVCGWRVDRRDPWTKRIASRVANRVRDRFTRDGVHDTGCTLKAFRREAVQRLHLFRGMHRFLPALLQMEGCG